MRRHNTESSTRPCKAILLVFLLTHILPLTGKCNAQDRTVRVALPTAVANTSDRVKITESTELPTEHIVVTIARETKRIGIYHRGLKRFVLWNGYLTKGEKDRRMPEALISPHGIPMKDFGNGRFGVEHEFNALDPGVFIVNTTWTLKPRAFDDKNFIERKGNPVLLFVEPAAGYDNRGQSGDENNDDPSLQDFLELQYDNNPHEVGVLMPKFAFGND